MKAVTPAVCVLHERCDANGNISLVRRGRHYTLV